MKKNENKNIKTMSLQKALSFALSNMGMVLGFMVIGFIIGRKWGTIGEGIGVIAGALIAIFIMINELLIFMFNIRKKKKKEGIDKE